MKEKGESNVHGPLSLFEVLVLKTIILYLMLHGFDVTIERISTMYEMIVELGKLDDLIDFPLSKLDKKDIAFFIKESVSQVKQIVFIIVTAFEYCTIFIHDMCNISYIVVIKAMYYNIEQIRQQTHWHHQTQQTC